MNEKLFANLNNSLDHKLFAGNNYFWLIRSDSTAISIPSLIDINPSIKELNNLISSQSVNAVFFKTDFSIKNASEYIYAGTAYDLSFFDSKTRNQIRKSLKECVFKRPNIDDLYESAFLINVQTLSSQGRSVKYLDDYSSWRNYIKCLYETDDVYIWGAYHSGFLIAYSVFIKVLDKYYIYHPFSDRNFSASSPMNGLIYTFINHIIDREGSVSITYGLSSIVDKSSLDKFKRAMLFVAIPSTRIVYFGKLYKIAFSIPVHSLICIMHKLKLIPDLFFEKYKSLFNLWAISKKYFYRQS